MTPTRDQLRVLIEATPAVRVMAAQPRDPRPLDLARWSCRRRGWIDARGLLTAAGETVMATAINGQPVFYSRIGPRTWAKYTSGPVFWDLRA